MGKFIDLTGQKFGKWTVLKRQGTKNNQIYWLCQCECGTIREVNGGSLRNNLSTNCGCVRKQKLHDKTFVDLTGQKFNSLTVLKQSDQQSSRNEILWECQCDCGNTSIVSTSNLRSGNIKSCRQCGYKTSGKKHTINLIGQKFGLLTVIDQAPSDERGHTYWLCQCECGTQKIIARSSLIKGLTKSCGCMKSQGELNIIQILQKNNVKYEYQKKFEDCKFPDTQKSARFDFFVNNQYLIEYDGEQHFSYTNNGWCTKENFERLKYRDNFKNQWCKEHQIPLIRIPYWHKDKLCLEDLKLDTTTFLINF